MLTLCHPYMSMRALDYSEELAVYAARAKLAKDFDGWIEYTGKLWNHLYSNDHKFNVHEWIEMLLSWALRFEEYCR